MNNTVPVFSIVFMICTMLAGVAIPVVLIVVFRRRYRCGFKPFLTGAAVMLLFALVLEQLAHMAILGSSAGSVIKGNIWFYGLYGGLMAGLFEETGRMCAFRTLLRKDLGNNGNALMYGAGHGGFEAFYLLTIGMINNLVYSLMINAGQTEQLTGSLSGAQLAAVQSGIQALVATPSAMFLVGILERVAAVSAQLSLSVLVWFAVKKGRTVLYLLAILLHLLLDALTVIVNSYMPNILLTEVFVWAASLACVLIALRVWRKEQSD